MHFEGLEKITKIGLRHPKILRRHNWKPQKNYEGRNRSLEKITKSEFEVSRKLRKQTGGIKKCGKHDSSRSPKAPKNTKSEFKASRKLRSQNSKPRENYEVRIQSLEKITKSEFKVSRKLRRHYLEVAFEASQNITKFGFRGSPSPRPPPLASDAQRIPAKGFSVFLGWPSQPGLPASPPR